VGSISQVENIRKDKKQTYNTREKHIHFGIPYGNYYTKEEKKKLKSKQLMFQTLMFPK